MVVKKNPELTVCIITYNHSRYIEDCIESVLFQKGVDEFKIVIADDYSTDGTRDILLKYKEQFPDKFELILQKHNVGAIQNWIDLILYPESKYVAYMEGDDKWIEDNKLSIQLNFIKKNEDCVLTFSNGIVIDENGRKEGILYDDRNEKGLIEKPSEITSILSLANGNFIHSGGILYRNILLNTPLPEYLKTTKIGDWPFYLFLSKYGNVCYINSFLFAYRTHSAGSYSKIDVKRKIQLSLGQFVPMLNSSVFDYPVKEKLYSSFLREIGSYIDCMDSQDDVQLLLDEFSEIHQSEFQLLKEINTMLLRKLGERPVLNKRNVIKYLLSKFRLN